MQQPMSKTTLLPNAPVPNAMLPKVKKICLCAIQKEIFQIVERSLNIPDKLTPADTTTT